MDFVGEHMCINKTQKNVCILLFTFILLLGMCFDTVQVDSFFSCTALEIADEHSTQTLPALEGSHNISFLNQICSEVTLGQPTSAIQQQVIRRSFRTGTGKGYRFAYLFLYLLPLLFASILTWKAYSFIPDIRKSSIIIRYIQHKDGKKPHLSFEILS